MVVYTDSIRYAEQVLPRPARPWSPTPSVDSGDLTLLAERLFENQSYSEATLEVDFPWKHLFAVASSRRSQYDILVELARETKALPDGIICIAGSGDEFHGFRNRPWAAVEGNLHLSVYLAPAKPIEHYGIGFTILAAVSVVEALDRLPGLEGKAKIKWVNDILVGNAKVCGVLAFTQTVKDTVTAAVVGIGLNVETIPSVEPTPFVPEVTSLRECSSNPEALSQSVVLNQLILALARNYRSFVDGGYPALLESYRRRSAVIGREVTLCSDDSGEELEVIAKGRVSDLGKNLEISIEGYDKPFWKGRLILEP